MPSLSAYSEELRSEGFFGYEAVAKIGERMASLNDSQLLGMRAYLEKVKLKNDTESSAGGVWSESVMTVLDEVNTEYYKRKSFWDDQERTRRTRQAALDKRNMIAAEAAADLKVVHDMIESNALKKAQEEIDALEENRRHLEKLHLAKQIAIGKDARTRLWVFAVVSFLAAIVSGEIIGSQLHPTAGTVAFVAFSALSLFCIVRGQLRTLVRARKMTDVMLQELVNARKDELMEEAMHEQRKVLDQERKAKLKDKAERRERKHARRAKRVKEHTEARLRQNEATENELMTEQDEFSRLLSQLKEPLRARTLLPVVRPKHAQILTGRTTQMYFLDAPPSNAVVDLQRTDELEDEDIENEEETEMVSSSPDLAQAPQKQLHSNDAPLEGARLSTAWGATSGPDENDGNFTDLRAASAEHAATDEELSRGGHSGGGLTAYVVRDEESTIGDMSGTIGDISDDGESDDEDRVDKTNGHHLALDVRPHREDPDDPGS